MINIENIIEKLQNRQLSTVGKHRYYSVLVPLIEIDDQLHILFEVRSQRMNSQPGEICFPGGGVEDGETPKYTAIRETFEEIGILQEMIEIIAEGDRLVSTNNFTVYSFFGILEKHTLENIVINYDEVSEVFTVPLQWFMDNEPEIHQVDVFQNGRVDFPYEKAQISPDYNWRGTKNDVPIYNYENRAIWGLTGRIVRNFIQILKDEKK